MRRITATVGVLLTSILLAGCASDTPAEIDPSSFVGSNVAQLEATLPESTAYVVYDVSLPVVDKEARYGEPGAGTNRDWMIVVACGSVDNLAVGVVNGADYTEQIAESARESKFDDLLAECTEN